MADILTETKNAVERLQNFDAKTLARREELGFALSFEEAVEPAQRLVTFFQQVPLTQLHELTDSALTILRDRANSVFSVFNSILEFQAAADGASNNRTHFINEVKAIYSAVFDNVYPLIAYLSSRQRDFAALEREARAAVQAASDRADELKQKLEKAQEDAERILTEVRKVAAEQGVSQQAVYFKTEADTHETAADTWRRYTVYTAIGLGAFTVLSFGIHKIPFIAPANTYETVQVALSKTLLFSVMAFMLILCSRNFMSHKHNAIVNRHRQNALLTFNSLVEAAAGEDKKDIVLTHAAACIFSPQETGYAKTGGSQESGSIKLIEIAPKVSGGASG